MKDALGISEDQYQLLLKRLTDMEIYEYLVNYGQGMLSLYYYADRIGGPFTKPKYKTDLIANEIFNTLSNQEQMRMYEYFEWLENNPE